MTNLQTNKILWSNFNLINKWPSQTQWFYCIKTMRSIILKTIIEKKRKKKGINMWRHYILYCPLAILNYLLMPETSTLKSDSRATWCISQTWPLCHQWSFSVFKAQETMYPLVIITLTNGSFKKRKRWFDRNIFFTLFQPSNQRQN